MQHDLLVTAQKCSVPIGALNTLSTTSKRYITTTFAASASQSSDSTLHNVLNQSITQDPLDQKELILSQDDNGRTHPTEDTASTPAPIPSHTTRSSPRDIHNISTTRDLTTTFAASASQPSDSTPQNSLNQSIRDLLDRKELNSIQDDNGRTPPTEGPFQLNCRFRRIPRGAHRMTLATCQLPEIGQPRLQRQHRNHLVQLHKMSRISRMLQICKTRRN